MAKVTKLEDVNDLIKQVDYKNGQYIVICLCDVASTYVEVDKAYTDWTTLYSLSRTVKKYHGVPSNYMIEEIMYEDKKEETTRVTFVKRYNHTQKLFDRITSGNNNNKTIKHGE